MTTADQLFDDYKNYRLHTNHYKALLAEKGFLASPKRTTERMQKFDSLIAFCTEHDLEPRLYLYSLFECRKWSFAPRWEHLVPGSKKTAKKAIDRYKALKSVPIFTERLDQERVQKIGVLYDPNRDINESIENVKRRYLGDLNTDRCMAEMSTLTLGYHPRSVVCARCPVAQACEQQLRASVPFDIIALRRGDITLDQAQRYAGWYHGSH